MHDGAKAWLFIGDAGGGRLLRGDRVPPGRYRLEIIDRIQNTWEAHEHGRPSARAGRDGHSYASPGHEREEMAQRFARDVSAWLDRSIASHGIARLVVAMPASFLGRFRRTCPPVLAARVVEVEGDFTHLEPAELAAHPTLAGVVNGSGRA